MASELDLYLDQMLADSQNFENYEADDQLESLENLAKRTGNGPMMRKIQQIKNAKEMAQNTSQKAWGQKGNPRGVKGNPSAQFTLTITRETANIAQYLPIALFGYLDSFSAYELALNPLLQGGTVLDAVSIGRANTGTTNRRDAVFTFKNGGDTDTIRISCKQVPYSNLLAATGSDAFTLSTIRYDISDAGMLAQFNQELGLVERSIFGKQTSDTVTPASYKAPDQFQAAIVDLLGLTIGVDSETVLTHSIANKAGFQVNLNMFVSRINKTGRSGL